MRAWIGSSRDQGGSRRGDRRSMPCAQRHEQHGVWWRLRRGTAGSADGLEQRVGRRQIDHAVDVDVHRRQPRAADRNGGSGPDLQVRGGLLRDERADPRPDQGADHRGKGAAIVVGNAENETRTGGLGASRPSWPGARSCARTRREAPRGPPHLRAPTAADVRRRRGERTRPASRRARSAPSARSSSPCCAPGMRPATPATQTVTATPVAVVAIRPARLRTWPRSHATTITRASHLDGGTRPSCPNAARNARQLRSRALQ